MVTFTVLAQPTILLPAYAKTVPLALQYIRKVVANNNIPMNIALRLLLALIIELFIL